MEVRSLKSRCQQGYVSSRGSKWKICFFFVISTLEAACIPWFLIFFFFALLHHLASIVHCYISYYQLWSPVCSAPPKTLVITFGPPGWYEVIIPSQDPQLNHTCKAPFDMYDSINRFQLNAIRSRTRKRTVVGQLAKFK